MMRSRARQLDHGRAAAPRRGGNGEKTRIIGYANPGGGAGYSAIPGEVQVQEP